MILEMSDGDVSGRMKTEVSSFDDVIQFLRQYGLSYTQANLTLDGKLVFAAQRKIGSKEWRIRLMP